MVEIFSIFVLIKIENSATEGADSRPASGPGTPSDEKAGQVGMGNCKKALTKMPANSISRSQLQRK